MPTTDYGPMGRFPIKSFLHITLNPRYRWFCIIVVQHKSSCRQQEHDMSTTVTCFAWEVRDKTIIIVGNFLLTCIWLIKIYGNVLHHDDETNATTLIREKKDQRAWTKFYFMIQPYCHVRNVKTARTSMQSSECIWEGLIRKLSLLRRLFSIKFEYRKSIETYISEIIITRITLADISAPLDDDVG